MSVRTGPSTSFWCELPISMGKMVGMLFEQLLEFLHTHAASRTTCLRAICLRLWAKMPHPTQLCIPSSP